MKHALCGKKISLYFEPIILSYYSLLLFLIFKLFQSIPNNWVGKSAVCI